MRTGFTNATGASPVGHPWGAAPVTSGSNADLLPAKAARDYLRSRVVGKEVPIRRVDTDRYGRTVGDLYLKPFESVGLDMVSSNHAVIYSSYAKHCPWVNELLVDGLTRYERRKKPVFAVVFRVRADRLYQRHWRFPSRASLESSTSNDWQYSLTYKKRQSGSTWGTSGVLARTSEAFRYLRWGYSPSVAKNT